MTWFQLEAELRATISVEWGYEEHSITLAEQDWNRVRSGSPVQIRGTGFHYEGQFFWDYWSFNTERAGSLMVTYCEPTDHHSEAVGFEGSMSDAEVEQHP